jgi:FdrA protein
MLADLARREDVGAVLLDVILGDLAHPDPAAALLPAIEELRTRIDAPVVATLIGSRRDPQDLSRQRAALEEAGVRVYASNAQAARAAGILAGGTA